MTPSGGAPSPTPRPASTVVLLRPGPGGTEALLTHRPATMAFGPGIHVFPGGAVDDADRDPELAARSVLAASACAEAWAGDLAPAVALAHAVAAIRELYEEAGVLLAEDARGALPDPAAVEAAHGAREGFASLVQRLDLRLRTDRLVPLSRWVTPPGAASRRYDVRFFVADAADGAGFRLDDREVAAHAWMTPAAAIDECRAERIELWAPTATTLAQVAPARRAAEVRATLSPLGPALVPEVEAVAPGVVRVRMHGAGGIPGATACAYVVGRRRLVVVDPGDPNEPAADAILGVAAGLGATIEAILLTAAEPSHAAGTVGLAIRAGAGVWAGPGTGREIWFGIRHLADGEAVPAGDIVIRAMETPGTHHGHLALDVPEAGVVLTGDLDGAGRGCAGPGARDDSALGRSRTAVESLGRRRRLGAHDLVSD